MDYIHKVVAACACVCPSSLVAQVTLSSTGGHSSMPPTDGSSIGDRLARFLSAMRANPGPTELFEPTSDFVAGLGRLAPGEGCFDWLRFRLGFRAAFMCVQGCGRRWD